MAWETRKGTDQRYYTRSHTVSGRTVREYIGTGARAEAIAAQVAQMAQDRAEARARQAQYRPVDDALALYCQAVDAAMRETLEAAGYHRHDRGHWRLRRGYSGIASGL
jgi:hypothetical protein